MIRILVSRTQVLPSITSLFIYFIALQMHKCMIYNCIWACSQFLGCQNVGIYSQNCTDPTTIVHDML